MSMLMGMLFWSSITVRGIINPIVVAAPAGANSALYFTIRNSARTGDRLLRVTCACARRIEVLAARGGDLLFEGESVIMPPERLVELRPGGNRHLFLLGLRRPLVAGGSVEMTFHYARGSETRSVRIVADAQTGWAEGLADPRHGPPRLAPMDGLAGWCWRGTFPERRRTETRCFSPVYGNFMQDRLVAEGGEAPRIAWTTYAHDVMGMTTVYRFTAQDGTPGAGRLIPAEAGITFEDYPQETGGRGSELIVRTHWRRDGADAWLVVAEGRRSAGWRELWRLRMVRAGPSPAF